VVVDKSGSVFQWLSGFAIETQILSSFQVLRRLRDIEDLCLLTDHCPYNDNFTYEKLRMHINARLSIPVQYNIIYFVWGIRQIVLTTLGCLVRAGMLGPQLRRFHCSDVFAWSARALSSTEGLSAFPAMITDQVPKTVSQVSGYALMRWDARGWSGDKDYVMIEIPRGNL